MTRRGVNGGKGNAELPMRRLRDSAPESLPQPPLVVSTFVVTKFVPSGGTNRAKIRTRRGRKQYSGDCKSELI